MVLEPLEFIARLVALIPPPRFHMLRYHGVLAAHAKLRSEVVPGPAPEPVEPTLRELLFDGEATELEPGPAAVTSMIVWPSRPGAERLLERVGQSAVWRLG